MILENYGQYTQCDSSDHTLTLCTRSDVQQQYHCHHNHGLEGRSKQRLGYGCWHVGMLFFMRGQGGSLREGTTQSQPAYIILANEGKLYYARSELVA